MSFQSLGASGGKRPGVGRGPLRPSHRGGAESEGEGDAEQRFQKQAHALSIQILKINMNASAIDKLVVLSRDPKGTKQIEWAQKMHDLNEATRSLAHDATSALKELAQTTAVPGDQQPGRQLAANKLQRDFEAALVRFQAAQRASAARNRDDLKTAQAVYNATETSRVRLSANQVAQDEASLIDPDPPEQAQQQLQAQVQKPAGPTQAELEFQESLIVEREAEITEIEQGILELNEIFRDLGHIVQEQGGMIDNIEYNITTVATHTGAADRELVQAHEYQRKAGRRAFCLLIVVGVVIAVVLLALLN